MEGIAGLKIALFDPPWDQMRLFQEKQACIYLISSDG
jgi:hypothetical protein